MKEDDEMNSVSKLISEVAQQEILYNPYHTKYKDSCARLRAWHSISQNMKIPVTDCQIKWSTLRRCLANARKRQMKRQATGSKFVKKWRYQDEMAFLLPYIDHRDKYEYINPHRKFKNVSVEYDEDDDQETMSAESIADQPSFFIHEDFDTTANDESQADMKNVLMVETSSNSCQQQNRRVVGERIYVEEAEIENITVDGNESTSEPKPLRSSSKCQNGEFSNEFLMDEMDTFFLSMSKALKKLPLVEQIQVRSQVYELVTNAEIQWLKKSNDDAEAKPS